MLIEDKRPHKPAEMASPAPSGQLQNAIKYESEMQKKACNSEMVQDTAKDRPECTAASKASSNFSSEEIGRAFEFSGVTFACPLHLMVGLLLYFWAADAIA